MLLALFLLLPLLASVVTYLVKDRSARALGVLIAGVDLLIAVRLVLAAPDPLRYDWLPSLGVSFYLAVDGSNQLLLLLTPLLAGLALLVTPAHFRRAAEFSSLVLLFLGALQGLFLSQNLGLFYIFYEVMLIPAILLATRWGGQAGRQAAIKFFLYTLAGSLAMLLGIMQLAFAGGLPNLDFEALRGIDPLVQRSLLILFAMAFVVKIPLVPFHGWLPDLYKAAPAQVTAVIAGVMSKAGLYGFLKVGLLVFPAGMVSLAPWLLGLGLLTVLYGGLCALGDSSTRGVLAYASLSHMGMMTLGLFALNVSGLVGCTLQMFAHGVATGGLFLVLAMLEQRELPRELDRLGGLAQSMPSLAAFSLVLAMASLGLPGLCSFPAEVLILLGLFQIDAFSAGLATVGILLAGWYTLRLYQGIMHGPAVARPDDLRPSELAALIPLVVLAVWIGFCPGVFTGPVITWLAAGVAL